MFQIVFSIAPIFLLIVLGYLLRRNGIPNVDFWNLNDKLVYWVLMPALIFYKTSTSQFSLDLVGSYAIVILGAFFCAVAFSLVSGLAFGYSKPVRSSILQGCARHNTFIAIAVADTIFGVEGLSLAILGTALLIPVTNVTVVSLMTVILSEGGKTGYLKPIARDLVRNPLLLAVGAGTSINLLDVGTIPVLHETTALMGNAAVPIVLMCVGANLRIRGMQSSFGPMLISGFGKLLLFPAVILLLSQALGLSTLETSVALIFGAAPTGSAAYTLARQMGGDAPLMAAIVTIQTAIVFVSLPATIKVVQHLLG